MLTTVSAVNYTPYKGTKCTGVEDAAVTAIGANDIGSEGCSNYIELKSGEVTDKVACME